MLSDFRVNLLFRQSPALLLLHTGKTHATKRNDQFCPQSHAITEKAFEHL